MKFKRAYMRRDAGEVVEIAYGVGKVYLARGIVEEVKPETAERRPPRERAAKRKLRDE